MLTFLTRNKFVGNISFIFKINLRKQHHGYGCFLVMPHNFSIRLTHIQKIFGVVNI